MNIYSLDYFFFLFATVFFYYTLFKSHQRLWLIIASSLFIISWHWSFLFIHLLLSFTGYQFSKFIYQQEAKKKRRFFLWGGITASLTPLVIFKYTSIFDTRVELTPFSGFISHENFNLTIPIGISFYTFQTIAYLVDTYRKQVSPPAKFHEFLLFTIFFPQLIMGPIERYAHLFPQFSKPKNLNKSNVIEGLYLISLGFLKKFALVNYLSPIYINSIQEGLLPEKSGLWFLAEICLGFPFFYCEFSSYMDAIRGSAKFFGVHISLNFFQPILSRNPADIWRRWHISLTQWIRDYIYLPLLLKTKNIWLCIPIMFVSIGFFHKVSWLWLTWGLYWSLIMILYSLYRRFLRVHFSLLRSESTFSVSIKVLLTLSTLCMSSLITWIQSFEEVPQAILSILPFNLGNSTLAALSPILLLSIIGVLIFIIFQESITKKESSDTTSCSTEYLLFFYFLNLALAFSLGSFSGYPFQYINF